MKHILIKHVPNCISIGRILLSLGLFCCAPFSAAFDALYLLGGLSDMADGYLARRFHAESARGERLDSAADLAFLSAGFVRFYPFLTLPRWLWVWITLIALGRCGNAALALLRQHRLITLHTRADKLCGALLFLLPLGIGRIDLTIPAAALCALASFAAVQEGIRIASGEKIL